MHDTRTIEVNALAALFEKLQANGRRIVAPVRDREHITWAEVSSPTQAAADFVQTTDSAKSVVFPRHEPLLEYRGSGEGVAASDPPPAAAPTVLFGVRPCDAASFTTLKAVFTWDSPDAFFEPKLANLTVISMACTQADAYCFCTSVGGGPGDTRGSDILLTPLAGRDARATRFLAEILTDRGAALVKLAAELFTAAPNDAAAQKQAALASLAPRFRSEELARRLPGLFDDRAAWKEQSLRCLGCGACAFVCPTCSCFDIQDERTRAGGVRLRCWDSCGFGLFTLHASGHNPRHVQSERWRQRVMHKFSYQPERLGVLGCVGCGRCSRACPVDMNLAEHAAALADANVIK